MSTAKDGGDALCSPNLFSVKMHLLFLFAQDRRYRILHLLSIFAIFSISFSYYREFNYLLPLSKSRVSRFSWSSKSSQFWSLFAPLLAEAAPTCSQPQRPSPHAIAKNRYYDDSWNIRPRNSWFREDFPNFLSMTDDDVQSMSQSHAWFVSLLNSQSPNLGYKKGTKGIVTSAGGSYFSVLVISLLMLRRSVSQHTRGIRLYEPQICDIVLPSLNAKYIFLYDIFKNSDHKFHIEKYQLKIFAILFSFFESLLFVDADNFPIHPPEELFNTEPFTTHKLILWPDYWTSTVSALFNNITGLSPKLLRNRPTIETGQILVSKSYHSKILLLAVYYNTYSEYFYPLITQGGPGEGGKDTFAPATLVLNSIFYTVESPLVKLGIRKNGRSAVVQHDPVTETHCLDPSCKPRPFSNPCLLATKIKRLAKYPEREEMGKRGRGEGYV